MRMRWRARIGGGRRQGPATSLIPLASYAPWTDRPPLPSSALCIEIT